MDDLKTGDLLLFSAHEKGPLKYLSWLIEYFTHSDFTHVAMILKNPTFIHPSLKGTFVWESSWEGIPDPQDGKIKFGVKLTPLHESLAFEDRSVFLRRLSCPEGTFSEKTL